MSFIFLQKLCYWFGSLICHQLLSRTLLIDGRPLPFCARDTGIYIGMFTAIAFLVFMKRWKCDRPPQLRLTIVLCVFIILMAIDGLSSYMGLRTTTNVIRLVSGGFFGLAIPLLLFPIANFKIYSQNTNPSLRNFKELLILGIILVAVCIIVYYGIFVTWWSISTMLIATMLLLYYRICYTVVIQVFQRYRHYGVLISLVFEVCLFICLYLFSTYIFLPLKQLYNLF